MDEIDAEPGELLDPLFVGAERLAELFLVAAGSRRTRNLPMPSGSTG
jgi:hypothetical protein